MGRYLIERLLQDGFVVRALVRECSRQLDWPQQVEVVVGDARCAPMMKTAASGCGMVFHFDCKAHAVSETEQNEATPLVRGVDVRTQARFDWEAPPAT